MVKKEAQHLEMTTRRLFSTDPDLAERVDAFVSRFGRLQDTLGDKRLPLLFSALGEKPMAMIDKLDRANRLGLIPSGDQ